MILELPKICRTVLSMGMRAGALLFAAGFFPCNWALIDGVKGATVLVLKAAMVAGRAIGRWSARAKGRMRLTEDMVGAAE